MNLHDRLRRELTHEVDASTRARHLAAASAAKGLRWDASATPAKGLRWDARAVSRRFAAGLAAFSLVAVPSAAMAQDALPGEALYPVKLAVEPLQALFDDDVVARHRADEVAVLLEDGDTPSESLERALVRAEEAIAGSNASDNARQRVADARARFEEKRAAKAEERQQRDAAKAEERQQRDAVKDKDKQGRPEDSDAPSSPGAVESDQDDATKDKGPESAPGQTSKPAETQDKGNNGNGKDKDKDKSKD